MYFICHPFREIKSHQPFYASTSAEKLVLVSSGVCVHDALLLENEQALFDGPFILEKEEAVVFVRDLLRKRVQEDLRRLVAPEALLRLAEKLVESGVLAHLDGVVVDQSVGADRRLLRVQA